MKIIGGIDVDRTYTGDEVLEMARTPHLRNVTLEGYCTRVEHDGTIRFVPFYESTWFREEQGTPIEQSRDLGAEMMADVNANHPIIRRTPQERVASMFLRLMTEYKRSGTLPGVDPALIKRVAGSAWIEGMPLTDEVIRSVAAHYLGVAEVDNKKGNFSIKDRIPEVVK